MLHVSRWGRWPLARWRSSRFWVVTLSLSPAPTSLSWRSFGSCLQMQDDQVHRFNDMFAECGPEKYSQGEQLAKRCSSSTCMLTTTTSPRLLPSCMVQSKHQLLWSTGQSKMPSSTGPRITATFVVSNGPQPSKVPQTGTPFHLGLMMFRHLTNCSFSDYGASQIRGHQWGSIYF